MADRETQRPTSLSTLGETLREALVTGTAVLAPVTVLAVVAGMGLVVDRTRTGAYAVDEGPGP